MAWSALRYVLVAATGLVLLVGVGLLLAEGGRGEGSTNLRRLGTNDADHETLTEVENKTVASQGTVDSLATSSPCLCTFDIDRTLTGKQGVAGGTCPGNAPIWGTYDAAYGGGTLTLSELGQNIQSTFCGGCHVGVVSTGSATGGAEKGVLLSKLNFPGALLDGWGTTWSDHSNVVSPLVTGTPEGTKQDVVRAIVGWYRSRGVEIDPSNVYHFDDRANNVQPFAGSGFNARQISCGSRDWSVGGGAIGLCGSKLWEVQPTEGVTVCSGQAAELAEEAPETVNENTVQAEPAAAATADEDVELVKPAEPQATEPEMAVNETRTEEASVDSGKACLCVFDIDRTLTGKQSVTGSRCPGNSVIGGVSDPAYGGGTLTLSRLGGAGAGSTFCGGCYVGIVSTGNGGGGGEKGTLVGRLGGRVLSTSWSSRGNIHSPFVTGVPEGTKQQVVHGIISWFASRHVQIASSDVYMFDDKASNIAPFAGSGFNAHQVSCGSRDGDVGLCGATPGEISSAHGISFCR